jgi:hypothetical protein
MLNTQTLVIRNFIDVEVIGIDQPRGELHFIGPSEVKPQFAVLKINGYMAWSARSEQTRIPASFQIWAIDEEVDTSIYPNSQKAYRAHMLFEFSIRKETKRRTYREGRLLKVHEF